MKIFKTYGKSTVEFTFIGNIPPRFIVLDSNKDLYYYRDLTKNNRSIKVNIAKGDTFTINAEANIFVGMFKKTELNFDLPPIEKNFYRENFKYVFNPNLEGTPARNFYKSGVIEFGKNFLALPFPIRVFILCHEIGHSFYHDEHSADLFACKLYLEQGYNKTMALHSLTDVLNFESTRNKERISKILKALK